MKTLSSKSSFTVALTLSGLFIAFALTGTGCGPKGKTLVKVNGHAITENDMDLLFRVNPRLKQRISAPGGKEKLLENYVEQELLYEESRKRGLDRTALVKDKIELYNKILVAQALLDDELDKKVKEYYDNHRDEFERLKLSHIFIRTASTETKNLTPKEKGKKKEAPKTASHSEAEAQKLIGQIQEKLSKGEDFGKLAKDFSEDEKTNNAQGDLGYVTIHDKRLERFGWLPLGEKAFAMKTGEVSDVIKTADGLHIIKVTEEKKLQSLEEADANIRFRIQGDLRTTLLDDLKKKYKVEYPSAAAPVAKPESAPTNPSPAPVPPAGTTGQPATPLNNE